MSNKRHEPIADLVAWLRRPREGENAYLTLWREEIADRIEAACKQSVTNCNRLGNAAKMREALENIAEYAKAAACHTEDAHLLGYLNQIERWAEAALSEPPRNCDVGTTDEQVERFQWFCDTRPCDCCTLKNKVNETLDCAIHWAQMPYEEGENAEVKK